MKPDPRIGRLFSLAHSVLSVVLVACLIAADHLPAGNTALVLWDAAALLTWFLVGAFWNALQSSRSQPLELSALRAGLMMPALWMAAASHWLCVLLGSTTLAAFATFAGAFLFWRGDLIMHTLMPQERLESLLRNGAAIQSRPSKGACALVRVPQGRPFVLEVPGIPESVLLLPLGVALVLAGNVLSVRHPALQPGPIILTATGWTALLWIQFGTWRLLGPLIAQLTASPRAGRLCCLALLPLAVANVWLAGTAGRSAMASWGTLAGAVCLGIVCLAAQDRALALVTDVHRMGLWSWLMGFTVLALVGPSQRRVAFGVPSVLALCLGWTLILGPSSLSSWTGMAALAAPTALAAVSGLLLCVGMLPWFHRPPVPVEYRRLVLVSIVTTFTAPSGGLLLAGVLVFFKADMGGVLMSIIGGLALGTLVQLVARAAVGWFGMQVCVSPPTEAGSV